VVELASNIVDLDGDGLNSIIRGVELVANLFAGIDITCLGDARLELEWSIL